MDLPTNRTPGDWYFEPASGGDADTGSPGDPAAVLARGSDNSPTSDIVIAELRDPFYQTDTSRQTIARIGLASVNGRLMAAAPDLYRALNDLILAAVSADRSTEDLPLIRQARAAMFKADTGSSVNAFYDFHNWKRPGS